MKRTIIPLLLLLLFTACIQAEENIKVNFNVQNPVAANVAIVYHMSVNEYPLSADGKATAEIEGLDAVYAKVYYGEKSYISFQSMVFK